MEISVNFDSAALFRAWHKSDNWIRRYPRGPHQGRARDSFAGGELDLVRLHRRNLAFCMNLHPALSKFLVGVASQFFAEFGENEFAGMHEHEPQHLFL